MIHKTVRVLTFVVVFVRGWGGIAVSSASFLKRIIRKFKQPRRGRYKERETKLEERIRALLKYFSIVPICLICH